ncbi:MBL fold metallo-hydrolase [Streptomyces sp. NPDC085900]|uniref:MBL fold metallo-hydrolase n=1 Tax=Streptomyces sp. NPDC085900 TaxID=3365737 RepID=UPI0037D8E0A4
MNGSVTVLGKGAVRIHSYMSPADTFHTTTQLIETPARIIAIDAQLLPAYADEAVAYAKGLGKPIDRLIVTHAHPDHYNGASRFGVPVHALARVSQQIVARGDSHLPTGQVIPLAEFTPSVALVPGTEVIDGVTFVFEAVSGGEAADELLIKLPEQGVLIAQDLVYHDLHLYLGNNDIIGWQQAVSQRPTSPWGRRRPGPRDLRRHRAPPRPPPGSAAHQQPDPRRHPRASPASRARRTSTSAAPATAPPTAAPSTGAQPRCSCAAATTMAPTFSSSTSSSRSSTPGCCFDIVRVRVQ